jgi:hypothetical protein
MILSTEYQRVKKSATKSSRHLSIVSKSHKLRKSHSFVLNEMFLNESANFNDNQKTS